MRILRRLAREATLDELAQETGLARSTTHHHLTQLRAGGLVALRGNARGYWYALRPEGLADARRALGELGEAARDGSSRSSRGARRLLAAATLVLSRRRAARRRARACRAGAPAVPPTRSPGDGGRERPGAERRLGQRGFVSRYGMTSLSSGSRYLSGSSCRYGCDGRLMNAASSWPTFCTACQTPAGMLRARGRGRRCGGR